APPAAGGSGDEPPRGATTLENQNVQDRGDKGQAPAPTGSGTQRPATPPRTVTYQDAEDLDVPDFLK
ncbi:MAG: cell division protein FtsZ, partial [Ornithinimicrobium sp.]